MRASKPEALFTSAKWTVEATTASNYEFWEDMTDMAAAPISSTYKYRHGRAHARYRALAANLTERPPLEAY